MKRSRLDTEERKEQILSVALEVFSRKGFTETTNRDIADAAGIASPGLIYHYFPSKSDLLLAVLLRHTPVVNLLDSSEALMEAPLDDVLHRVADAYLDFLGSPESVALTRILIGESLRNPDLAEKFAEVGPMRLYGFLNAYFARQMELGHLRPAHPDLVTRSFIGPIMTVVFTNFILGIENSQAPPRPDVLAHVIQTFLSGMSPIPQ